MNHIAMVITQTHHGFLIARVPYGVITTLRPDTVEFTAVARHRTHCASIDSTHRHIVYLHRRHSITIHSKPTTIYRATIMRCKRDTIASHRHYTRRCGRRHQVDASRPHKHHCSAAFDVLTMPTTITTQIEDMCIRRPDRSTVGQVRRVVLTTQIIPHHRKYITCTQSAAAGVYATSIWTQMQIRRKSMCTQRRRHRAVKIHRHRGLDRTRISTTLPRAHRIHTVARVHGASNKTIKLSPMSRIRTTIRRSQPRSHHVNTIALKYRIPIQ